MAPNKKYKFFDHTADIGISVYNCNLKDLFVYSAKGMFEILGDQSAFQSLERRDLDIKGENIEELLHKWLSLLLYYFDSEKIFFTEFTIKLIDKNFLNASVSGEKYAGKESFLKREIKAVTHHQMEISENRGRYRASVIFDI